MSENQEVDDEKEQTEFGREVRAKAVRKLHARRNPTPGVWSGLGMMGLIGWSVVVPTLLGTALGHLAGSPSSGKPFLDAGVAGRRFGCRLS